MQSKLLVLRKENGYTQEDIAKQLNITTKTYSLKERGKAAFDSDEMFLISNFFGKSISDIFLPRSHQNGNKVRKDNY